MSIHQEFSPQLISLGFIPGHSCWPTDTPLGPVSSHQAFFPNEGEKQMSIDAFHQSTPNDVCASHEWSASEPFRSLPWFLQKLGCLEVGYVRLASSILLEAEFTWEAMNLTSSEVRRTLWVWKGLSQGKLGLKLCYDVGIQHSFQLRALQIK